MSEHEGFDISRYVPVRSLWVLQLYASSALTCGAVTDSGVEDPDADIPMLVAELLCGAVEQRMQRELTIGFTRTQRNLNRLRGKINVLPTLRGQLLEKGQINCTFNDLTVDSPVNRYLLRALNRAATTVQAMKKAGQRNGTLATEQAKEVAALAARARRLCRTLTNAGVPFLADAPEPRGRLSREDRKPVALASLMLQLLLPDRGTGHAAVNRSDLSEEKLRKLFEAALLRIYRFYLTPQGWQVHGAKDIHWAVDDVSDEAAGHRPALPRMRTDITLVDPEGRLVIVDAKFTNMAVSGRHGDKLTLKSQHLYQIHSYVTMAQLNPGQLRGVSAGEKEVGGVMVFAALGTEERLEFPRHQEWVMNGHPMAFSALDLMGSARAIRDDVLAAVGAGDNRST